MAIKTVQSAYETLVVGEKHLDFVNDQISASPLAMKSINALASAIVRGGEIRQSDLLSAVASAMSIGIKIGLEMNNAVSAIVGPGGTVIQ